MGELKLRPSSTWGELDGYDRFSALGSSGSDPRQLDDSIGLE